VNCSETMKLHPCNIRLVCVCVCVCVWRGGEGRVLKLMTHLHPVLRLGMNRVTPSLPCVPYGIYTDNFAFILYIYSNSSIELGSVVCRHCSVQCGVLLSGAWNKTPTNFCFSPTETETCAFVCVLLYDIFVNCKWVATRWQLYNTHLHTSNTQNNTKQTIHRTTQNLSTTQNLRTIQKVWKSAGRAPTWQVLPWHLPYNWGKSMEKPQSG
jgi:hypothetical protein